MIKHISYISLLNIIFSQFLKSQIRAPYSTSFTCLHFIDEDIYEGRA